MFDLSTGQSSQVAQHDAPVKVVKWVDAQSGILATGSWDKTVKVRLGFMLLPDTDNIPLVLGSENAYRDSHSTASRTLLFYGCPVPTDGSRNRRASCSDFQSEQPKQRVQGKWT